MGDDTTLASQLKSQGGKLGFEMVRIAPAVSPPGYHPLLEWIEKGFAADMEWISRRSDAYQHPDGVLPGTRSVVMAAMNYHNLPPVSDRPRIARYAWGTADYHTVLRQRLKQLARILHSQAPEERTRVIVDTAPLLERNFGQMAGLGWFGKNTMLINRDIGSWFFLGAILTTALLEPDVPFEQDFCGTCTRCLDACPTNAFPEPHVLDSARCISYLTIERRDKSIPEQLREGMQDWLFGCDICQEVCPWNRFAPDQSLDEFLPRQELSDLSLHQILEFSHESFQAMFRGTPLERTGRDAIVRNAAVIAGNVGAEDVLPVLQKLQNDEVAFVAEAALWAIHRIQAAD